MVRHSLAARSLRHLRFARRMTVGQPLLARASEGIRPGYQPTYVALDGRQALLGHILRRLPHHEVAWADDAGVDILPASDGASEPLPPEPEPALRLLPPLDAPDDGAIATGTFIGDAQQPTSVSSVSDEFAPMMDDTPATAPAPGEAPRIPEPARPDGRRPRSRIVELPGVIIQPLEPEGDESDGSDEGKAAGADASAETAASIPERERQAQQPPLLQDEPPAPATPVSTEPRRRGGKRAAQPPRASDALFPPTDADRSPQSWLARLQQPAPSMPSAPMKPPTAPDDEPPTRGAAHGRRTSERGARGASRGSQTPRAATSPAPGKPTTPLARSSQPPDAPDASDTVEQPAPIAASSRTLLHEATGVDPASVPIYRGVEAARATSAHNADALTDGEAIALGAGHATDTPETLGLLAHELAHVAQRRSPRFVPPAAQATLTRRPASRQPQPQPQARPATSPVSPADEEAQAALVEARVTSTARARQAVSFTAPVAEPERPLGDQQPPRSGARPLWGNLPAPWEPLPDWLASPGDAPEAAAESLPGPASQQPGAHTWAGPGAALPTPGRAPSASSPVASAPAAGVQRAERGRALPAESEAAPAHPGAAPEPDLDALAQQVHAILKRRLAAERRRFG